MKKAPITEAQGADAFPARNVTLADARTALRLFRDTIVGRAEGTLTVEDGTLYDLLDLAGRNMTALESHPLQALQEHFGRLLRFVHTYNPVTRARRNVASNGARPVRA